MKSESKGSESNHVTHDKQSVDEAFPNVCFPMEGGEQFPTFKTEPHTRTHTHTP